MDDRELKRRTQVFALRVMKMVQSLPHTTAGQVIAKQIVRSATSVGTNYRAACRGRSKAEFFSNLQAPITNLQC
jgi:four helix bundle protein